MSKKVLYNNFARKALEKGMDVLNQALSVTLGPKGKNVVLERSFATPQIVNDGITIAKAIQLENQSQNTGAALVRQATAKTNDVAGDGTTTATVLAHAIVKEGMKNVSVGLNPVLIKKGIEKAIYFIVNKIYEYSSPVSSIQDIIHVASIAAGNDSKVGLMVSEAIQRVGKEGVISLEESQSASTYLEITEGMKFDRGFISPYFLSSRSNAEIRQENPLILLTDKKITLVQQELVPILEQVARTGRSLLIIADDIEKEALATLIVNKLRGVIDVVAVRAPAFGDKRKLFLQDIAILTGGQVISSDLSSDFNSFSLDMMGSAKSIIVSKSTTTIIANHNDLAVQLHCAQIRKQIDVAVGAYEKQKLQDRLSKMSGGVAIIKIGAATQIELEDKKLRFEDAVNAAKAAIQEGIIPGGGSALVHLAQCLDLWSIQYLLSEELVGAQIVSKALCLPFITILNNAGLNGMAMVEQIQKADFVIGYDANKDSIANMYKIGIVDPAKVTRSALQNASSIASVILTTECMIIDELIVD